MRERDRLERELRASEDRYRTLASSSPDLVFATDAEGRYTFLSDRARPCSAGIAAAALGRSFMEYVAPGFEAAAAASYEAVLADPERVQSTRIDFLDGSGQPVQLEDQHRRQGRGRRARRDQRRRARRVRARAPRARARPIGGALPVPHAELAGRRLLHRRRGEIHVHLGGHRAADGDPGERADRAALRHDRRVGGAPGRGRPLGDPGRPTRTRRSRPPRSCAGATAAGPRSTFARSG